MATQKVDLTTTNWTKVNTGACAVFKDNNLNTKVCVGTDTPDDTSPYVNWEGKEFSYDGADDVYMKSCVTNFSVIVIT